MPLYILPMTILVGYEAKDLREAKSKRMNLEYRLMKFATENDLVWDDSVSEEYWYEDEDTDEDE